MEAVDIRRYRTAAGREPFSTWLSELRDARACAKVLVRLERLALGNFGDCRSVGHGISELRIGGDKGSQTADIRKAQALWQVYERRRYA